MENKRGKVAIIFGASRGIGYEIALKLSTEYTRIFIEIFHYKELTNFIYNFLG